VRPDTFGAGLDRLLARRSALSAASRRRAEEHFAFDVLFPRYLAAAASAVRRPVPGPLGRLGGLWRDASRRLGAGHR
jgi:hypothetical protein